MGSVIPPTGGAFVSPTGVKITYDISGVDKISDEDKKVVETALAKIQTNERLSRGSYILTSKGAKKEGKETTLKPQDQKRIIKVLGKISANENEKINKVSLKVIVALTPFQNIVEEASKTEQTFLSVLEPLAKAYEEDQEKLVAVFKKNGYSENEIHLLFSQLPEASKKAKFFEKELSAVNDLAQQGKKTEAMNRYAKLINNHYEPYVEVLLRFAKVNSFLAGNIAKVEKAMANYYAEKKEPFPPTISNAGGVSAALMAPIQRFPRHGLLNKEIVKEFSKEAPEAPLLDEWTAASQTISKVNTEANAKVPLLERAELNLTESVKLTTLTQEKAWMDELGKNKQWKKGSEKGFFRLLNDYGTAIKPLREAYNQYRRNPNLENRIVLRAIAKRQAPTINKLNAELKKIEGGKKARILQATLANTPIREKEKKDVGTMMRERVSFANELYSNPDFNLSSNPVSVKFDIINHADPDLWSKLLKGRNLTQKDIDGFNDFYVKISNERENLNEILHNTRGNEPAFKREAAKIMSNLTKLERDFNKWGGVEKIQRMRRAMGDMVDESIAKINDVRTKEVDRKKLEIGISELDEFPYFDNLATTTANLHGMYDVVGVKNKPFVGFLRS